jgi:hypothetical protein
MSNELEQAANNLWQNEANAPDFWTSYTQLLQKAKQHQAATPSTKSQAQPKNANQWTTLMPADLPLTIPSHSLQTSEQELNSQINAFFRFFLKFIAFITLIVAGWNYSEEPTIISGMFTLAALFGLWALKVSNPSKQTELCSLEFLTEHMLYKQKTKQDNSKIPPYTVVVPYETIESVYDEALGISIEPTTGVTWRDNRGQTHFRLVLHQRMAAFGEVEAFIQEVIKHNQA